MTLGLLRLDIKAPRESRSEAASVPRTSVRGTESVTNAQIDTSPAHKPAAHLSLEGEPSS